MFMLIDPDTLETEITARINFSSAGLSIRLSP